MGTRDPRVDAYVAKAAPFARPVLAHLREVVHAACPEAEETLKWGSPHFMYNGMLCGMAAFKQHCAFGFWKGGQIAGLTREGGEEPSAGHFGRITAVADLPPDAVLAGYVREAMRLNAEGVTRPATRRVRPRPPLAVPADFTAALEVNERARATFDAFAPSHRRDYVEWVTEAKTAATRERRLATAMEWLAEGKSRNWKYERER